MSSISRIVKRIRLKFSRANVWPMDSGILSEVPLFGDTSQSRVSIDCYNIKYIL